MRDYCHNCGRSFRIDDLDAKPRSLKGKPATAEALEKAADRGANFSVLECRDCYGPAFVKGGD